MPLESMFYAYITWVLNNLGLISSCALAAMAIRVARHFLIVKQHMHPEPIWVFSIVAVAFVPVLNMVVIGYQLLILAMVFSCKWEREHHEG